jgi:hypothetical protein
MIPVQSKLIVAYGNPMNSEFIVPCGVEVILYDQTMGTVPLYIVDDIVNKLSAAATPMAMCTASTFKDIPLFNRELTMPSDVYQRTFSTGNRIPDFSILYASAPPLQKSISGIFNPASASIEFSPDGSSAIVKGFDLQNQWLIGSVKCLSELLNHFAVPPSSITNPIRCFIVLTPSA